MKLKQVMILVLSGLSFGLYCPPEPPVVPHEVSSSHEVNSSASHTTTTAEKSQQAEQQKVQDQTASQAEGSQSDASAVATKSNSKSGSNSSSKKSKSVSFGDDSTHGDDSTQAFTGDDSIQTFTIEESVSAEDSVKNSDEANDDYREIDKHDGLSTDRISSDFGKDNEDITEHNTFMNKYDTKPTQAEVAQYKQGDDIETSAAKEAKKLEPKARAAKNESDVQSIVKEIDTEGVLTDEDIQTAVKAGKEMWLNNFDPLKFQDWVELVSRFKAYATDGLTAISKEDIKSVLSAKVNSMQSNNSIALPAPKPQTPSQLFSGDDL